MNEDFTPVVPAPDHTVRNIIIVGVLVILTICCCGTLFTAANVWLQYQPVAEAAQPSYMDPNPIPYAQAKTCPDLAKNEIRAVETGMTIAGDVSGETSKGAYKDFFQSDIGEYTVVVNMTGSDINVKAPFGAGCLMTTDVETLVQGEITNPNHTDLKSVRVVVYTAPYTYTETWYGPDGKVIK